MTLERRSWWVDDPARLELEKLDVASVAPDLEWVPENAGRFEGEILIWPFSRPEPIGLRDLVKVPGRVHVEYRHAFPAVPPTVICKQPTPPIVLRSFEAFHVLPNGALCLLRDADQWTLNSRTSELLLKASGWIIEYALLEAGAVDRMTKNGIVEDDMLDELISSTAKEPK
ncbi:hypothetical protein HWD99_05455 [Microbacterium sp. C5A9]|uniref:hypothetical protein n=1 Tax=Microbacterium sp. C5A9 TaxID=2736663 RepID=UPI001F526300|nr:hypothetical protein [Microbacterium sp. C5A9]MCI1018063.1 hypothetical protein [Microbacterium sp. C5A9]